MEAKHTCRFARGGEVSSGPPVLELTLIFFSLPFLENGKENHQKNKDFLCLPNPSNPWERREKRSKSQGRP